LKGDIEKGFSIGDLSSHAVGSSQELIDLYILGIRNRVKCILYFNLVHLSDNLMNIKSISSHRIFTIIIQSLSKDDNGTQQFKTENLI
jgi:hypothetical protein